MRRIVTLTMNPALDLASTTDFVSPHHKLRCGPLVSDPGGGGINVSRVCQRLGQDTVAVTPIGGPLGEQLASLLEGEGVGYRVVPIEGETRPSFTMTEASSGDQYRFVFPGPTLTPDEVDACVNTVIDEVTYDALVVISGSMPVGAPPDLVGRIIESIPLVPAIVDTSGPGLAAALRAGAFMVKPSARELASVVGRDLHTDREVTEAAVEALEASSVHALIVSIGAGGAILVSKDAAPVRFRAPTVRVSSAVGAGDSMVAGIAVGLCRQMSLHDAVAFGIAAGTAAVLTPSTQLCSADDVDRLLPDVVTD